MNYATTIAEQLNLGPRQVEKTIELLEQGATIPFIARYRKEVTGSLNEVQITAIRDLLVKLKELDKRREAILASINEQGKLTGFLSLAVDAYKVLGNFEHLHITPRSLRSCRVFRRPARWPPSTSIPTRG